MSANLVELAQRAEAHQDSLAERMARSPLSLLEGLRCATEIAAALRDLHEHGLVYGAVSSQLIELGPSGATLRSTGVVRHLGDSSRDVAAFGAVLEEMSHRAESVGNLPDALLEQAHALALRCRNDSPPMQQVSIALRLLALQVRHCGAVAGPMRQAQAPQAEARQAVVRPMPAAATPVAKPPVRVRVRIRLTLRWKPLANLAVFALSGK
jgi:hypothetical protein